MTRDGDEGPGEELTDDGFRECAAWWRESRKRQAQRSHERRLETEARRQTAALERLAGNRSGPPPGLGLTVEAIIATINGNREDDGTPPTQSGTADLMGKSQARVRQVHKAAGLSWVELVARADRERAL
jgi:hypothetical protein